LSYLWTNETPTIGTITFGTANAEDTTILADTDGTYTIRLTVSDKAGNIAFDEITFIWDTTRPEPLTASPSDGSTGISIASGTTSVTFDEPVVLLDSSRILFVDDVTGTSYKGTVAVNGSNPAMLDIPYSALNYGTKYRVNVKPNAVSDVATNKLNSNFISYFTTEIDTVAPVVDSSSAGSITTSGATLYVTTDENANCGYALTDSAYNAMTPFTTTGTASHYTAVSGLSPSTGHDYYVRCADTSTQANEMTSSAHISFTTLTPDTTAPVITNIQANANDAGATITWATDENATSRVEYGLTSGYGSFTASDTTADLTSHSVIITGLTPGEDYHFRILSDDASLNAGVSGDNTFTTADTTAPAVPVITTASATTDADTYTLAGTIANDGGARTISVYNGATPAGTTIVPTGSTSWTLLVQLTQETANVFTATASDVLGNPSAPSSSVTIIEATATGDVTDPAIPVITTADATVDANEYTISGTAGADDPADATNGTRTITIYNNGVVMGSIVLLTGETDWSFVASLNQNTGNTFSAHSTDESGNTSDASNSVVITELSVADTTAPATPIITTGAATVDANEYTISGTAGADEPTDGTRTITIYRNTVTTVVGSITLLSGQTEWSFVAPLTQNSSNTFTAISTDEAGNNSVVSNSVTITESTAEVTSVVVTNISAVKTYATVGGDYAGGWEWTFNVTVPTTETELQMKFDDWTTSLPNTISAAGNIRYSSVQASNGPFEIVTTGTYGGALHLTNDLDSEITGRQIQIKVEARVPAGSSGGSYSTSYGIQSLPQAD